jgi:hypothetical protein
MSRSPIGTMFRRSSGEAKPGFVFLHFQPVLRQVAVVGCSDRKEESGLYPILAASSLSNVGVRSNPCGLVSLDDSRRNRRGLARNYK